MRKFLEIMTTGLAITTMLSVPAIAQTPDGTTPAEEAVCDVLQADGTTKGLYGLCVAFCEAHDTAELSTPITLEELEALAADAPSGKILANYNKKKKDTDPTMPCLLVQEPESCPCFTDEELTSIDGFRPNGAQVLDYSCEIDSGPPSFLVQSRISETDNVGTYYNSSASTINWVFSGNLQCRFYGGGVLRNLSSNAGTLNEAEFESCKVKLNEYIPTSGCPLQN